MKAHCTQLTKLTTQVRSPVHRQDGSNLVDQLRTQEIAFRALADLREPIHLPLAGDFGAPSGVSDPDSLRTGRTRNADRAKALRDMVTSAQLQQRAAPPHRCPILNASFCIRGEERFYS